MSDILINSKLEKDYRINTCQINALGPALAKKVAVLGSEGVKRQGAYEFPRPQHRIASGKLRKNQ